VAYMASSPDEAALVSAAQAMGFIFHVSSRSANKKARPVLSRA